MSERKEIPYRIRFSRRRTISITISPDKGVIVGAPYRTSAGTIERIVRGKSEWINRTLEGFLSLRRLDNKDGYSDGDEIMLFGRIHKLRIIQSQTSYVRLSGSNIIEAGVNGNADPSLVRTTLELWFHTIAKQKLTAMFAGVLAKHRSRGFNPSGFSVRKMKKRWGSCSSKGNIAVSYDLIRLDDVFSEYVIIHELCHLKHHNHSRDYYRLLSEVYPGWKSVRKELRTWLR